MSHIAWKPIVGFEIGLHENWHDNLFHGYTGKILRKWKIIFSEIVFRARTFTTKTKLYLRTYFNREYNMPGHPVLYAQDLRLYEHANKLLKHLMSRAHIKLLR